MQRPYRIFAKAQKQPKSKQKRVSVTVKQNKMPTLQMPKASLKPHTPNFMLPIPTIFSRQSRLCWLPQKPTEQKNHYKKTVTGQIFAGWW